MRVKYTVNKALLQLSIVKFNIKLTVRQANVTVNSAMISVMSYTNNTFIEWNVFI